MTVRGGSRILAATCGVAAVIAGVVVSAPTRAQQQTPDGFPTAPPSSQPGPSQNQVPLEHYGDWMKKCGTRPGTQERQCYLIQAVAHTQNAKKYTVLLFAVGYYGDKQTPRMVLRVPLGLGVFLPGGITLTVPSVKPIRVEFETCLPRGQGCSAVSSLSREVITAMKKATTGTVDVVNLRRQRLRLPVSFKGFTAGLAALEKE